MKHFSTKAKLFVMALAVCLCVPVTASYLSNKANVLLTVDSEGRYFVNDFEDNIPMTEAETSNGTSIFVEGEGEWQFKNAFVSTNTSYVVSGEQNLRLKKNDSYVVTPVLNKGVKAVTFTTKRYGKKIVVSVSTDGGHSWTEVGNATSNGTHTITVENMNANRVKISNDASKDADIDDLIVTAQAYGIEAQVATGDVANITKNTADLSGSILDRGDQPITDLGIVWSTHQEPTVGDFKESTDNLNATEFTISADGLKASTTYYYRAFAVSNAGTVYGESKSFTTEQATPAVITTKDITRSINKYVSGGIITDDGGADIHEVGVLYGETAGLTITNAAKVNPNAVKSNFIVTLPVQEGKTYYVRAYVTTTVGTNYGEEKQFTIDENIEPTPDVSEKIWCSPDGDDTTADGTEANPFFSLDKAIAIVEPGMTINMKAGTYVYDHRINIDNKNGEPDAYIKLTCPDGRAILDFSGMPYHAHSDNPLQGVRLTSSYWHFYRVDICNASDNGLLIERNKPTGGSSSDIVALTEQAHDNIIEECNFYKNGDTGLQIKNLGADNYIINCDSYLNCDEDEGDADGFAPKISVGDGNYFYGCRAYLNSDDGWDVFYKKDGAFGDNMTIIMDHCISYKNGFLNENTIAPNGNGNGFKCGSNQGAMNVYLNHCLAISNKAKGFDQNHNSGDIIMNNCTGMTRTSIDAKSYSYRIYEAIASDHVVKLTNCIAINDNDATDKRDKNTGETKAGEHGKQGQYGRFEIDETLSGLTITTCEFQKAHPDFFVDTNNDAEIIAERNADGSLPETTFAHIKEGASHKMYDGTTVTSEQLLIGQGTTVTDTDYRGISLSEIRSRFDVPAEIEAPSLGAYEFKTPATGIGRIAVVDSNNGKVRLVQCQNGMVVVGVDGATAADEYQLIAFDASGKLLGQHTFNAKGSIYLPAVHGTVILKVVGNNVNDAVKVIMK